MKVVNRVKFEMLNNSLNEGFARVAVAAFVAQTKVTIEELSDIKTAVSEAVTNAIVHGYGDSIGMVTLECIIREDTDTLHMVEIAVSDHGCGIEDIERAREPLYTSQPEMERSGMGFTVMETFMDEVIVESDMGLGTKVVMRKAIRR